MTTFSLDIPENEVERVIDALCLAGGYEEEILGENEEMIPNPMTKEQYAKSRVIGFITSVVGAVEHEAAVQVIREQQPTSLNIT